MPFRGKWRLARFLLPALGVFLLATVIRRTGWATIRDQLMVLRWWLVPLLTVSGSNYILFSAAWWFCLKPEEKSFSFWRLLPVKLIGEAVNATTPLNFAAGDPARVYLMKEWLHWRGSTRSVVVERTLYIIAVVSFIVIGFILFLSQFVLPTGILDQLLIGLVLLLSSLLSLFLAQRKGFFRILLKIADAIRLGKKIPERRRRELLEIDSEIHEAYRTGRWRIALAFGSHFLSRCVMLLETALILWIVGSPLPFSMIWGLTALVPLTNFVFGFIPGGLGVLEGVSGLAFYLLHLDPAVGVSLQLVRRLRSGFWVIIGGSLFLMRRAATKSELAEERACSARTSSSGVSTSSHR